MVDVDSESHGVQTKFSVPTIKSFKLVWLGDDEDDERMACSLLSLRPLVSGY